MNIAPLAAINIARQARAISNPAATAHPLTAPIILSRRQVHGPSRTG
ncbi:hypothetical protein TIFTF001_027309 [Ficus carica]|uniref:Uncharacterized protein n=1 Tax=Ficus carica TaxID=3494 RepID=A0AA88IUX4_FICCA|nr:hypothetical protein TIFTF001_027309 [Ficus carica]